MRVAVRVYGDAAKPLDLGNYKEELRLNASPCLVAMSHKALGKSLPLFVSSSSNEGLGKISFWFLSLLMSHGCVLWRVQPDHPG